MIRRPLTAAAAAVVAAASAVAYENRPGGARGRRRQAAQPWYSQETPRERAAVMRELTLLPWLQEVSSWLAFLATSSAAKLYFGARVAVELDAASRERVDRFVSQRRPGQALLTFSNHTSVLDDPALIVALTPWRCILSFPSEMRWGVCSSEICFKNDFFAAYFGAGHTLPIMRGDGVMQRNLADLEEHVVLGHWTHIFPEGRTYQDRQSSAGRFKWGLGKLIAAGANRAGGEPPLVVPVFHNGMHTLLPHDEQNQLLSWVPRSAEPHHDPTVHVRVGEPVPVDDLLTEHRQRRRAERASGIRGAEDGVPSAADRWLWSAVTDRCRAALLELGSATPRTNDTDAVVRQWKRLLKLRAAAADGAMR